MHPILFVWNHGTISVPDHRPNDDRRNHRYEEVLRTVWKANQASPAVRSLAGSGFARRIKAWREGGKEQGGSTSSVPEPWKSPGDLGHGIWALCLAALGFGLRAGDGRSRLTLNSPTGPPVLVTSH